MKLPRAMMSSVATVSRVDGFVQVEQQDAETDRHLAGFCGEPRQEWHRLQLLVVALVEVVNPPNDESKNSTRPCGGGFARSTKRSVSFLVGMNRKSFCSYGQRRGNVTPRIAMKIPKPFTALQ